MRSESYPFKLIGSMFFIFLTIISAILIIIIRYKHHQMFTIVFLLFFIIIGIYVEYQLFIVWKIDKEILFESDHIRIPFGYYISNDKVNDISQYKNKNWKKQFIINYTDIEKVLIKRKEVIIILNNGWDYVIVTSLFGEKGIMKLTEEINKRKIPIMKKEKLITKISKRMHKIWKKELYKKGHEKE